MRLPYRFRKLGPALNLTHILCRPVPKQRHTRLSLSPRQADCAYKSKPSAAVFSQTGPRSDFTKPSPRL
jgi:hypothetical protein